MRLIVTSALVGALAAASACSTSLGSDPDLGDIDLPNRRPFDADEDAGTDGAAQGSNEATLTVTLNGAGAVSSTPAGLTCAATTCSGKFARGTTVTLQPAPSAGSVFTEWTGKCSGAAACAPILNADATVTATFLALDGQWKGTYTNKRDAFDCTFTNTGNLDVNLTATGTATTASIDGLELRNGSCDLAPDKATGTAPSSAIALTDGKLTGTWTFNVLRGSTPLGTLAFPFTATFSGKTMTGSWTCPTCTGSFTLTKQ